MKNRWAISSLLVLWLWVFVMVPLAWAQQGKGATTVNAVGDSPIRGDNMSASRQASINSGLIAAVTSALTDMVSQDVMVGNFQMLNEAILNQADKFVRDYKVLTESTQGKRHRVLIQATVSNQRLKNALKQTGIHLGRKPYPKVLFCLAEKALNGVNSQYWWGSESQWEAGEATQGLQKMMKSKGYLLVAPRKRQGALNYPPELSAAEAVALGRQLGAQVVVAGEAFVDEATNTMGGTIRSFRATIGARAYRVDTGEAIGQSQRTALHASGDPHAGSREALYKAALMSGEDLALQIADAWFSKAGGLARTEVAVEGVGGQIANFVKFRGALSAMSGVESVQLKEMLPDTALLAVAYQGSTRGLADDLLRQNFNNFGINIVETSGRMIRLQLVPR